MDDMIQLHTNIDEHTWEEELWSLRHFQQHVSYFVAVSFIGERCLQWTTNKVLHVAYYLYVKRKTFSKYETLANFCHTEWNCIRLAQSMRALSEEFC